MKSITEYPKNTFAVPTEFIRQAKADGSKEFHFVIVAHRCPDGQLGYQFGSRCYCDGCKHTFITMLKHILFELETGASDAPIH